MLGGGINGTYNNQTEPGLYELDGYTILGRAMTGLTAILGSGNNKKIQIAADNVQMCFRRWSIGTTWTDWNLIYSTSILGNSSGLSELASALKPYL